MRAKHVGWHGQVDSRACPWRASGDRIDAGSGAARQTSRWLQLLHARRCFAIRGLSGASHKGRSNWGVPPALVGALLLVATLLVSAPARCARSEDDAAALGRRVDAMWAARHAELGRPVAAPCDDATFLRRLTLDLTGITPTVGELRMFVADTRPDKRSRAIAALLERPRHATHLAGMWRDALLPRTAPANLAEPFESWLRSRFERNVPYDQVATDVLLARGAPAASPSVLFYAALEVRPPLVAAGVSRAFLGIQLRCAECHDHPFTDWRQEDFWAFAAFFARLRGPAPTGGPSELDEGPRGEVRHPKTRKNVPPRLLVADGLPRGLDEPGVADAAEPRRAVLARWLIREDNDYFAQAAVNRAWSLMFGRGLVEPVDDLGPHNPPSHPEVLELLADDFVEHGYDLRRILRALAETELYQQRSDAIADDAEAWREYRAMPRRSLTARQVYECLLQATGRRDPLDPDAPELLERRATFLAALEAPVRQATEFQGGIPQALVMLHGPLVDSLTRPESSDLVRGLAASPFLDDSERIEILYLSTLSRLPTTAELDKIAAWLGRCGDDAPRRARALSDLLWALVNSTEFVLNR